MVFQFPQFRCNGISSRHLALSKANQILNLSIKILYTHLWKYDVIPLFILRKLICLYFLALNYGYVYPEIFEIAAVLLYVQCRCNTILNHITHTCTHVRNNNQIINICNNIVQHNTFSSLSSSDKKAT